MISLLIIPAISIIWIPTNGIPIINSEDLPLNLTYDEIRAAIELRKTLRPQKGCDALAEYGIEYSSYYEVDYDPNPRYDRPLTRFPRAKVFCNFEDGTTEINAKTSRISDESFEVTYDPHPKQISFLISKSASCYQDIKYEMISTSANEKSYWFDKDGFEHAFFDETTANSKSSSGWKRISNKEFLPITRVQNGNAKVEIGKLVCQEGYLRRGRVHMFVNPAKRIIKMGPEYHIEFQLDGIKERQGKESEQSILYLYQIDSSSHKDDPMIMISIKDEDLIFKVNLMESNGMTKKRFSSVGKDAMKIQLGTSFAEDGDFKFQIALDDEVIFLKEDINPQTFEKVLVSSEIPLLKKFSGGIFDLLINP